MKALDLIKFALDGLKRRKARTFLTVLGVVIGTVCIVLMFSIGLSNYTQFQESILDNQSLTQITVNSMSSSGSGIDGNAGITDSTIASLELIDNVKTVSPIIDLPVMLTADRYEASLQVRGIESDALDLKISEGNMFDDSTAIPSIVLGGYNVQSFVDPENPPNYYNYEEYEKYVPNIDLLDAELIMLLGYGYEDESIEMPASLVYRAQISGITEKTNDDNAYYSYIGIETAKRIIMDNRELAEKLGLKVGSYNTAVIIVDEMDNVQGVLDEVRKLGFETYSPTEWITQMQEEQSRQQGQLLAIGFISLLVSAIGIANTMYANILERRSDIGVMKVIGMKIKKIRSLFVTESAFIGLLGGLIGIGISYCVTLIINTGSSESSFLGMYFSQGMHISIPIWLCLSALIIAVAVGVVSGLYPAYKATKMSPLEAMRH